MLHIIEKYLSDIVSSGLNKLPKKIEEEMSDPSQEKNEEWRIWNPIPSMVTDSEIEELELRLGYKLPDSYKRFLKYKHFYELYISECSFCEHPIRTWRTSLIDMIFEGYPRKFLIDRGRIPFASWSDWGLLCFDATITCTDNNYPIVLWDHEMVDRFEFQYPDFESMIIRLDKIQIEQDH